MPLSLQCNPWLLLRLISELASHANDYTGSGFGNAKYRWHKKVEACGSGIFFLWLIHLMTLGILAHGIQYLHASSNSEYHFYQRLCLAVFGDVLKSKASQNCHGSLQSLSCELTFAVCHTWSAPPPSRPFDPHGDPSQQDARAWKVNLQCKFPHFPKRKNLLTTKVKSDFIHPFHPCWVNNTSSFICSELQSQYPAASRDSEL